MLRIYVTAFLASFVFFFCAWWAPEAATYLVAQTFAIELARSHIPLLVLMGAGAAALLVRMAYRDWCRRQNERLKVIDR